MQILTLNIRHGGGRRVGAIADYVSIQAPDVFLATEFRNGPSGTELKALLRDRGYHFQWTCSDAPRLNSVLLASRVDGSAVPLAPHDVDAHRVLGVRFGNLTIIGVYFAGNGEKESLFDYFLSGPIDLQAPSLLLGDINTGRHRMDEPGATFYCADRFERLSDIGWTDAWRHIHGEDAREFSWVSRVGNGFRIDHAFSSPALLPAVTACTYDHTTRPELTDHSGLMIEFSA